MHRLARYIFLLTTVIITACAQQPPAASMTDLEQATPEQCLAVAMYFETDRHSAEGMKAMGELVLNRVNAPRYPDTVCGVITENFNSVCEFSLLCNEVALEIRDPGAWALARSLAGEMLAGDYVPQLHGATIYRPTDLRLQTQSQTLGMNAPPPGVALIRNQGGNLYYR